MKWPSEPGSQEEEEGQPGLPDEEDTAPMSHEEGQGDEDEAIPGPSSFRRVGREEEKVQADLERGEEMASLFIL